MTTNDPIRPYKTDDEQRQSNRSGIYSKQTRRKQILSDRSRIGMFEEGLEAEYLEYSSHSQKYQIQQESERLIDIAKKNNLYFSQKGWGSFGEKYPKPTRESNVYYDFEKNRVTKIKDPFKLLPITGNSVYFAIYEHIIHNMLFPNTRYEFIGVSEDIDGVRIVLQQQFISTEKRPSENQIKAYFQQLNFFENSLFYENEYLAITDVSENSDNVLLGDKNELYFIDPVIKLKKPIAEIWSNLLDDN